MPLEYLLFASFLPLLFLPFVAIHFRATRSVSLLALPAAMAALELSLVGFRWHLVPAYLLSVLVLLPLGVQVQRSWRGIL